MTTAVLRSPLNDFDRKVLEAIGKAGQFLPPDFLAYMEDRVGVGQGVSVAQLTGRSQLPGSKLASVAFTAPVAITATTEGTAQTIATLPTVALDGVTEIDVEFVSPKVGVDAIVEGYLVLFEGATVIAYIAAVNLAANQGVPVHPVHTFTPTAGSHTYTIKGYVATAATMTVQGGAGGAGYQAAFARITRAA